MRGYADLVIGLIYGDEGKAKIVDFLTRNYNTSLKWNGSHGAGGSQEKGKTRVVTNLLPAGSLEENVNLFIGLHCRVNPIMLMDEIERIESCGIEVKSRILIDGRTGLIQPHHQLMDGITGGKIGTTKKGTGPSYADTALRQIDEKLKHISIANYIHDPRYRESLKENYFECLHQELEFGEITESEILDTLSDYNKCIKKLETNICYDRFHLNKLIESGKNILLQGSNGPSLDPEYGHSPFVTSSRTLSKAAALGTGLNSNYIRNKVGVMKAIQTRVGWGHLIGEFGGKRSEKYTLEKLNDNQLPDKDYERENFDLEKLAKSSDPFDHGRYLRMMGNEYGATTGRCRRIAPLDLIEHKNNAIDNEINTLVLTKLDCLNDFQNIGNGKIPFTVGYKLFGKEIYELPMVRSEYESIEPIIEYLPTFADISNCKTYEELPNGAKDVIKFIEHHMELPIIAMGTGPKRENLILRDSFKKYF